MDLFVFFFQSILTLLTQSRIFCQSPAPDWHHQPRICQHTEGKGSSLIAISPDRRGPAGTRRTVWLVSLGSFHLVIFMSLHSCVPFGFKRVVFFGQRHRKHMTGDCFSSRIYHANHANRRELGLYPVVFLRPSHLIFPAPLLSKVYPSAMYTISQ